MTDSHDQYSLDRPPALSGMYIPDLEGLDLPESTDLFRARALDACLDAYIEYAVQRLKNGNPLNHHETRHLVHRIKASSFFKHPRKIVWRTRPIEELCKQPRISSVGLNVVVNYTPVNEEYSAWLFCYEYVATDIKFFDMLVGLAEDSRGGRIEGPQFEGSSDSGVYILVEGPAGCHLLSIGKWMHAGNLCSGLKDVWDRVVDLVGKQSIAGVSADSSKEQNLGGKGRGGGGG